MVLVLILVGDVMGGVFSRTNGAKRLYRQRDEDE